MFIHLESTRHTHTHKTYTAEIPEWSEEEKNKKNGRRKTLASTWNDGFGRKVSAMYIDQRTSNQVLIEYVLSVTSEQANERENTVHHQRQM